MNITELIFKLQELSNEPDSGKMQVYLQDSSSGIKTLKDIRLRKDSLILSVLKSEQ